jgi:hypothetical protein
MTFPANMQSRNLGLDTTHTLPSAPQADRHGADVERATGQGEGDSLEDKGRDMNKDEPIDYEKMEHQQIGVTRIETLWRHFGNNKPVLTALGASIFCTSITSTGLIP